MRALSIKQPFVEQILKGKKKIEYRSVPTNIIGERFYIYASEKFRTDIKGYPKKVVEQLPCGLIVGTVIISRCDYNGRTDGYEWYLEAPKRLKRPFRPKNKPQPVWFIP